MVTAIVGANWGDEGKGKITDLLASESDIDSRAEQMQDTPSSTITEDSLSILCLRVFVTTTS